jgi:exonuclease VII small subunit
MKINEIEDSSRAWASLKGINLDQQIANLEDSYRNGIEFVESIYQTLSIDQKQAILSETARQVKVFEQQSMRFEHTIQQLNINDADLKSVAQNYKSKAVYLCNIVQKL